MDTPLIAAAVAAAIRANRSQSEYDISRTVLQRLIDVRWAPKPDQELARRALRRHVLDRHEPPHDQEEP